MHLSYQNENVKCPSFFHFPPPRAHQAHQKAQKKTTKIIHHQKNQKYSKLIGQILFIRLDIYILRSSIYPYSNRNKNKQVNIYNTVGRGAKTKYIIPRKII